ncbi:MAG: hypothetical protein GY850_35205 [bacterium]|nr:hypothetical protein [bacterium]
MCETTCPKYPHDCSSQSPPTALELTNCTVDRTAFTLEKDDYGIDTVGEMAFSVPATRILAELEIRFSQVPSWHSIPVWINPERYRSQGRPERLQACKRFEIIGTMLEVKLSYSRSTLSRDLLAHPAFAGILRRRKGTDKKLRDLYETDHPHDSWQLDAKGPSPVTLINGKTIRVHVLSILDDFSRYILAAIIAPAENIEAAVKKVRFRLCGWDKSRAE